MYRVSFLTTLNIYKAILNAVVYGEHMQKVTSCFILSARSYCVFCAFRFYNQVLLDLHYWWSKELCSQQHLQVAGVSHILGSMQNGDVHILKSSKVLKQ